MSDLRIYVATHKPFKAPVDTLYTPIQVGAALTTENLRYCRDDSGDNISYLNKNFCELTALYWIWKNTHHAITGLVHYRRYFGQRWHWTDQFWNEGRSEAVTGPRIASRDDFAEFSDGVDLIAAYPNHISVSLLEDYAVMHGAWDMYLVREVIAQETPQYLSAFDFVMNGKALSLCNMVVARKEVLDCYCAWLFPILFKLQKMPFYKAYDDYQKRAFGFISERLLNVWICYNRRTVCVASREIVGIS